MKYVRRLLALLLALTMALTLLLPGLALEAEEAAALEEPAAVETADPAAEETPAEEPAPVEEETPAEEETPVEEPAPVEEEVAAPEEEAAEEASMAQSGVTYSNSWTLSDDGVLTINFVPLTAAFSDAPVVGDYYDDIKSEITAIVIGAGFNEIAAEAFADCTSLTSVTFSAEMKTIGDRAFNCCTSLRNIVIPDGVTTIGGRAFHSCTNLRTVSLPSNLKEIGSYAFQKCSALSTVSVPLGTTSIYQGAFDQCTSLTSVSLPGSLTTLERYAFTNCSVLSSITIPANITTIAYQTFSGCTRLRTVTLQEGLLSIEAQAFKGCSALTGITLPDSLLELDTEAFKDCTSLTSITIPGNVIEIPGGAFKGCSKLASVTLPAGLTSIKSYAFSDCSALTSIRLPSNLTTVENDVFYGCTSLASITIPASMGTVAAGMFNNCTGLKTAVISEGITAIDRFAFNNCTALEQVTLPSTLETVGWSAFGGCAKLTSAVLPEGVTTLDDYAFCGCTSLTPFYIPASVTTIGSHAYGHSVGHANFPFATAVIQGVPGSAAETYANDNNIPFVDRDEPTQLDTPTLTKVENVSGGVKVTWGAVTGAAGYQVYRKTAGSDWDPIGAATSTSYTDKTAKSGTAYTYTICCLDEAGNPISDYDTTGMTITYLSVPAISKLENVSGGVKVTWGKVTGAAGYRVYRKTAGSKWGSIGTTTSTSYTDKTAKSGTAYTYTIRCLDSAGNLASAYDTTGKTITYLSVPAISKLENVNGGVKVTWGKVTGAAKYRLFVKTSSGWKKVADTTGTSATFKGITGAALKSGTTYRFTVRCLSSAGKLVSAYNTTGKTITYLSAPVISSVTNSATGVTVKWGKVAGAAKYRVFRKTGSGSWTKVGDTTGTSYTDKTAKSGTTYRYTVRCLNSAGNAYTSAYNTSGKAIVCLSAPKLSAAKKVTGGVRVTWAKVTGATSYRVYRKTSGTGWKQIGTTTSTSYTDKTVKRGTTYQYTVRAVRGSTLSGYNSTGLKIKY